MIELPYKEDKFRMIILLPDDEEGLPEVVKKVSEKGLLEDVFRMYPAGADVDLDMPKFEIKSKHDLNDILPKVSIDFFVLCIAELRIYFQIGEMKIIQPPNPSRLPSHVYCVMD